MLLIHNDQPQILHGQHNGRSGSQNKFVWIWSRKPVPYLNTYAVRATGVIYAHVITEHLLQTVHYLCGEGYLRQQVENLPALADTLLYKVNVNLGLSARCNTMQQANVFAPE